MERMWWNAPILRDICSKNSGPKLSTDRATMVINDSAAIAIPVGPGGEKIRGLRGNMIINDEFQSSSPEIYETVLQGFGAVSADPVENIIKEARKQRLIDEGRWTPDHEFAYQSSSKNNQSIIAGTADYAFKHFAGYWKKYKAIIESRGDPRAMEDVFGDQIPEGITWKDFSIIRIPIELIPKGFMDPKTVGRAKANIHSGIYNMEYGACFLNDSTGFFRRTLIEACVTSDKNPIRLASGDVWFDPITRGDLKKTYIYGVDPAAEQDNFAIVIIEINPDHNRVVYSWTTNKKDFRQKAKIDQATEKDFYGYCARKIRNLMKVFPCARIGIDSQGGGIALEEVLHDPKKLEHGEQLLWPIIDPDDEKPTDDEIGLHIIEMINFADFNWTAIANHGLRKDMEDRIILFPRYDPLTLGMAYESGLITVESQTDFFEDSLEDCIYEIEELKNELTTIVMTRTGTAQGARDRWDTPEIKDTVTKKKGRLRKDRYSALIIANMLARQMSRYVQPPKFNAIGGDSRILASKNSDKGRMYDGANWLNKGGGHLGVRVARGGQFDD